MGKKKKKEIITTVVVMVVLAGIIISAFLFLGKRDKNETLSEEPGEVEALLSKNLSEEYPATPREVVRLYGRIMKCLYAMSYNDEEFSGLSDMLRELYDEELLEKNPKNVLEAKLEQEVEEYKSAKKEITYYEVQSSSSAETSRIEGREYVNLKADFLVWEKGKYTKAYEEFSLRQDEEGRWKILGWRQTEPFDLGNEGEEAATGAAVGK